MANSWKQNLIDLWGRLGNPAGDTLTTFEAKFGDIARSLDLILGARWDGGGDLGTDIVAILAGLGVGVTNGLVYYGVVNAAAAPNFTIVTLAGLGAGKFSDATAPYQAFVLRSNGGVGAAPQGEMQAITGYVTATGVFTTPAFTVAVAVNDEILIIHPRLAEISTLLGRLTSARGGYLDNINQAGLLQVTAARAGYLDSLNTGVYVNSRTTAFGRLAGTTQTFEINITSAANAGDVTVATITTQPCLIKSVVLHANAAQTANLTSAGIFGGTSKVITFISATDAINANLSATDKQIGWTGVVRLAATRTIVISLVGTGGAAVNLQVIIEYMATVDGGYLV